MGRRRVWAKPPDLGPPLGRTGLGSALGPPPPTPQLSLQTHEHGHRCRRHAFPCRFRTALMPRQHRGWVYYDGRDCCVDFASDFERNGNERFCGCRRCPSARSPNLAPDPNLGSFSTASSSSFSRGFPALQARTARRRRLLEGRGAGPPRSQPHRACSPGLPHGSHVGSITRASLPRLPPLRTFVFIYTNRPGLGWGVPVGGEWGQPGAAPLARRRGWL